MVVMGEPAIPFLPVSVEKTAAMKIYIFLLACLMSITANAQVPCNAPQYRQFDFWLGEWEAFGKSGQKAGDSRISLILDSCIVLEEWTSSSVNRGLRYAGKSFNTWNASTSQWQQTWVDNTGGSTEYLDGRYAEGKMIFLSRPFPLTGDTVAIRRLTFFNIGHDKIRQLGEISRDNGGQWAIEYDLEYRRKK